MKIIYSMRKIRSNTKSYENVFLMVEMFYSKYFSNINYILHLEVCSNNNVNKKNIEINYSLK